MIVNIFAVVMWSFAVQLVKSMSQMERDLLTQNLLGVSRSDSSGTAGTLQTGHNV